MKLTTETAKTTIKLEEELERIQRLTNIGHEVRVLWLPGAVRYQKGKKLKEFVRGNTIEIYAKDDDEALELVRHGFIEWLLNEHSKIYRLLINKQIELLEEVVYERKEQIADTLAKLLSNTSKVSDP